MDITERCKQCSSLIHDGNKHLRHFHCGYQGRYIVCISCLAKAFGITPADANTFWNVGRQYQPKKYTTQYNSWLPLAYLVKAGIVMEDEANGQL